MDVIELIYQLKRAGYTQVSLARELGVSRGVVNDVVHDRKSALRVATRIADAVGVDVEVLWPGRYSRSPLHKRLTINQQQEQKENIRQK